MKFQTFWYGSELSPFEWLCLTSFTKRGYQVDLYTYETDLVCPEGVTICKAEKLISRKELVFQKEGFGVGSPAAFSDRFRYHLLTDYGGWWVDTDVICLGEVPVVDQFYAFQDNQYINNAILYFTKRHPVTKACMQETRKMLKSGRLLEWGDTGPRLLTRMIHRHRMLSLAVSPSLCYPLDFVSIFDIFRATETARVEQMLKGALFLHLWNAELVDKGIDKGTVPESGSWLRKLGDNLGVEGWKS